MSGFAIKFQQGGIDLPHVDKPAQPPSAGEAQIGNSDQASFRGFCETCAAISPTTSKLEKIRLLAQYLQTLEEQDLARTTTWFTGVPFASSENRILQLGWALLRDALCIIGGIDAAEFHQIYLKHSDVGETAA